MLGTWSDHGSTVSRLHRRGSPREWLLTSVLEQSTFGARWCGRELRHSWDQFGHKITCNVWSRIRQEFSKARRDVDRWETIVINSLKMKIMGQNYERTLQELAWNPILEPSKSLTGQIKIKIQATRTQITVFYGAVFPCIILRFEWETPAWCSQIGIYFT